MSTKFFYHVIVLNTITTFGKEASFLHTNKYFISIFIAFQAKRKYSLLYLGIREILFITVIFEKKIILYFCSDDGHPNFTTY